jgi:hypothetical protein
MSQVSSPERGPARQRQDTNAALRLTVRAICRVCPYSGRCECEAQATMHHITRSRLRSAAASSALIHVLSGAWHMTWKRSARIVTVGATEMSFVATGRYEGPATPGAHYRR